MLKSRKDSYHYFLDIPTRWNDNDMYGHINNAVYYTWFDTLVNNFLIENGLLDPQTSETIGLVVDTGCQYFAPLSYPETVTVGLRAAKIGTSSVRYEIGVFKKGEVEPCAQGHFVHVYVDAKTRKPKPMSADMRAKLTSLA
jgi:acyl-CoA thioester hydrolase